MTLRSDRRRGPANHAQNQPSRGIPDPCIDPENAGRALTRPTRKTFCAAFKQSTSPKHRLILSSIFFFKWLPQISLMALELFLL